MTTEAPNLPAEQSEAIAIQPTALDSIVRAEFDVAIMTARRFPRSISQFRAKALAMATVDPDVAASCFYRLERRGGDGAKAIEGPSVRFAEIVAASYGNLRFGARIVDEGAEFVTAQGVAHDLENNVSTTVETRRRITDKYGNRYKPDMIGVTCNAACSIALRSAIFKAVPFSLAKAIYDQAKKVAVGDAKTLTERRTKMLAAFQSMGIAPARVFASVNVNGLDDIGLEQLEILIGKHTAIKDGDTSADEEFPDPKASEPKPAKVREAPAGAKATEQKPADTPAPGDPAATLLACKAIAKGMPDADVLAVLEQFQLHAIGQAKPEQVSDLYNSLRAKAGK